jgi:hypothetical protein
MEEPRPSALDHHRDAVPMPAQPMTRRVYGMLAGCSGADWRAILSAIQATGVGLDPPSAGSQDILDVGPGADQRAERKRLADWSLRECAGSLGVDFSRWAYDAWRSTQPAPGRYASATSVRRAYGDWPTALASLGAPASDVTARRLLSCGKAFSAGECRTGIQLFSETLTARRGRRGLPQYIAWARAYIQTPGAARVPLSGNPFTRHFRVPWAQLWALPEIWTIDADRADPTGVARSDLGKVLAA